MGLAQASRPVAGTRPALIQTAVFGISLALLAWSIAGLVANPDLTTGAGATSVRVLGVDFNGWHALSGFALFGPGLFLARREDRAVLFALAATASLVATGAWALADTRPAGIFPFDHNHADAVLHFGSAAAYAIVLGLHLTRSRRLR